MTKPTMAAKAAATKPTTAGTGKRTEQAASAGAGVTVWHNPRCGKSRQALAMLAEMGIAPTLRLYLETPPTQAEIAALLGRLQDEPRNLLRTGEPQFAESGLRAADFDARKVAALIARHPVLLQRPVIERAGQAHIARTPEAVRAAVGRS